MFHIVKIKHSIIYLTLCHLNRSYSDSVHVGRLDDRLGLTGQNSPVLGPKGAQLCSSGGHNSARLRWEVVIYSAAKHTNIVTSQLKISGTM